VPVYDGTADAVLDLAAGRIEHRALPGTPGNVGIAVHRDGFFRVLKDLKEGDALVLDTPVATEQYRVEWIRITTPTDVSVIAPTPGRAVTLVGCYRFYHTGPGPPAVHRARGARGGIARRQLIFGGNHNPAGTATPSAPSQRHLARR
jgi:sortase A